MNTKTNKKHTGSWYYNDYPLEHELKYQRRRKMLKKLLSGTGYQFVEKRINGNIYMKWWTLTTREANKLMELLTGVLPRGYYVNMKDSSNKQSKATL